LSRAVDERASFLGKRVTNAPMQREEGNVSDPWKRVFERGPDDEYEPPLAEPDPSLDARGPDVSIYKRWWEMWKRATEHLRARDD
jgi:hypothetical protein